MQRYMAFTMHKIEIRLYDMFVSVYDIALQVYKIKKTACSTCMYILDDLWHRHTTDYIHTLSAYQK